MGCMIKYSLLGVDEDGDTTLEIELTAEQVIDMLATFIPLPDTSDSAENPEDEPAPAKYKKEKPIISDADIFPTKKRKSKLDDAKIDEARDFLDQGMSYAVVAKKLGVSLSSLYTALPKKRTGPKA